MKRLIDIVLAVSGLIVGAPLIALIAMAIKLDSPGRVIFSQKRLGRDGEVFRIHKFRKFPDSWGSGGAGVTLAGDARMTRLGRFLERSKFDEIPQLWNILKGEMSFVGPRPESLNFADLFTGDFTRVHDFTPGIFGPNQVAFRNESEMYPPDRDPEQFYREELFPAKARNDIDYFSRSNVFTDLMWIVRGLWCSITEAVNWRRLIRNRGIHVGFDLVAIQAAWLGANMLRFEGMPTGRFWDSYLTGVWLLPLVIIPVLFIGGIYRQPVRHYSFFGVVRLAAMVVVGVTIAYMLMLALFHRDASLLLGPLMIVLTFLVMTGGRLFYRERWRQLKRRASDNDTNGSVRVAIYGGGRRGGALASLFEQGFPDAKVVGFFDDNDNRMRGREIMGRKVLGSERDLDTVHAVHRIRQLWLTFAPNRHKRKRLEKWCRNNEVRLVVLPETGPFSSLCRGDLGHAIGEPVEKTNVDAVLGETAG